MSNGTSSASLPAFSIVVTKPTVAGSPTISGSPETSVVVGNAYRFTPTTTDPSGGTLTFSIKNAPSWASFSSSTGELSGTPTAAEVGTYSNISISVSDGKTSATLPSFPIAVTDNATGSVTLSWTAPTENTNGTALTDLAGYWIYYGTSANALTKSTKVSNPGLATYVLSQSLARHLVFRHQRLYDRQRAEQSVGGGERDRALATALATRVSAETPVDNCYSVFVARLEKALSFPSEL